MWVSADWGVIEEDPQVPGSARVTTGCIWKHLPRWFGIMIAMCNRPAAAVESCRNEIVSGFSRVASALQQAQIHELTPPPDNDNQPIEVEFQETKEIAS